MSEVLDTSLRPVLVGSDAPDLEAAQALLNTELGLGMYSLCRLREIAAGPGAALHVCRDQGRLVAAAVTRLLEPEDVGYYERFGRSARDLFASHRVGSLEALAVEPGHRRRGLGRALARERLAWMADRDRDLAVGVAWISGRADSSVELYRGLGFTFSPPVPDFYLEESRRDGWTCPVCGGPCRCSAAFFYRLLR